MINNNINCDNDRGGVNDVTCYKVKAIKWYKNWHWHWQRNCDGSRNRNKKGTVNGTGNGNG